MKKILIGCGVVVLAGLLFFGLIQLVPYGHNHQNPPVLQEPAWDAPTRALAKRACFDCHSNESVWPWYSNIAPVSWLVQSDVDEGRQKLNFSEWGRGETEIDEIFEVIQEGKMPPGKYTIMHPSARLTTAERDALIKGLMVATGN